MAVEGKTIDALSQFELKTVLGPIGEAVGFTQSTAHMALAAGLTGRARSELDGLLASGAADRRAYLLFAELECAEHGDSAEGRAAEAAWLREAANAAGAPRWRCDACGAEYSAWKPDCAACGAMGRIGCSHS